MSKVQDTFAVLLAYCDGRAIFEDGFGDLFYEERPAELAIPGEFVYTVQLKSIKLLPRAEQAQIRALLASIEEEELDALRIGTEEAEE